MDRRALPAAADVALREYLERCTLPVVGEHEGAPGIYGSGTLYVGADGRRFFVTAAHVTDERESIPPDCMAVSISDSGESWTLGTGAVHRTSAESHDVAIYELTEAATIARIERAGHRRFLSPEHVYRGEREVLGFVVHGSPRVDAEVKPGGVVVYKPTTALVDLLEEPSAGAADFKLRWPEAWPRDRDVTGISGSPIWALLRPAADEVWAPERLLLLAGVETGVLRGEYIKGTFWTSVDAVIAQSAR